MDERVTDTASYIKGRCPDSLSVLVASGQSDLSLCGYAGEDVDLNIVSAPESASIAF